MKTFKIVGASAIALGAALLASGQASAQETCTLDTSGTDGGASATGIWSLACGPNAVANGTEATAVGDDADAIGGQTTAVGAFANAGATGATAVGHEASATGINSTVIGNRASDGGFANSVAIGYLTVNTAANQVAVGGQSALTARVVTGVANPIGTWDAVNLNYYNTTTGTATQAQINTINSTNATQAVQILDLQNADIAFDNRFDAFELDVDRRFDRMEDYVAGSTAVASALSGMAFLPDKSFNLTANVATYDGAYAGALQVGALIGPNAAINAGVASGFNKRGKTAVRAGITYGW